MQCVNHMFLSSCKNIEVRSYLCQRNQSTKPYPLAVEGKSRCRLRLACPSATRPGRLSPSDPCPKLILLTGTQPHRQAENGAVPVVAALGRCSVEDSAGGLN